MKKGSHDVRNCLLNLSKHFPSILLDTQLPNTRQLLRWRGYILLPTLYDLMYQLLYTPKNYYIAGVQKFDIYTLYI